MTRAKTGIAATLLMLWAAGCGDSSHQGGDPTGTGGAIGSGGLASGSGGGVIGSGGSGGLAAGSGGSVIGSGGSGGLASGSGGSVIGSGGSADAGADGGSPDTLAGGDAPLSPCGFSGGYVSTDLTLTKSCSPYEITSHIDVVAGATLTIDPGVTLTFAPGKLLGVNDAHLDIRGTESEPVVLTSAAESPAAGDWQGVQFFYGTMAPSRISHALIEHCGYLSSHACVWISNTVQTGTIQLDHVTIQHAKEDAIAVTGPIDVPISDCSFRDIPADHFAITVLAGSFGSIGAGNDFAGARIALTSGVVEKDTTWTNPGTDVVVTSTIFVAGVVEPATLTIGAGFHLLFDRFQGLEVGKWGDGHLVAAGTATSPVIFTSSSSSAAPGDWRGITVHGSLARSGIALSHAQVTFAGGEDFSTPERGGVLLFGQPSEATIVDSAVSDCAGRGIYLTCDAVAALALAGTSFARNASDPGNTGTAANNVGPGPAGSASCP